MSDRDPRLTDLLDVTRAVLEGLDTVLVQSRDLFLGVATGTERLDVRGAMAMAAQFQELRRKVRENRAVLEAAGAAPLPDVPERVM